MCGNKNLYRHQLDSRIIMAPKSARSTRSNREALNLVELQKETDKLPTYLNRQWEFVVRQVRSTSEKLMKLTLFTL